MMSPSQKPEYKNDPHYQEEEIRGAPQANTANRWRAVDVRVVSIVISSTGFVHKTLSKNLKMRKLSLLGLAVWYRCFRKKYKLQHRLVVYARDAEENNKSACNGSFAKDIES